MPLSTIFPAIVMSPPVRSNKIVAALLIVVAVTAFEKVVFAFVLIVVAATVLLNVVVPALIVSVVKGFVAPIALANVFPVPETVTVPSVVAKPLIVPLIVAVVPENVAEAVDVLSSKVIAVAVTVLANVACEFSAPKVASPPNVNICSSNCSAK